MFFLTGSRRNGFADGKYPYYAVGSKPFMEVPENRFDSDGRFLDPWGAPYMYFSCHKAGNDYNFYGLYYGNATGGYVPASTGATDRVDPFVSSTGKYINPTSYQIISAGQYSQAPDQRGANGGYGRGGPWTPGTGDYAENAMGGDDLSNFAQRILSSGD